MNNKIQNTQSINLLNSSYYINQLINEIANITSIPKEYINSIEFIQNNSNEINAEIYFNVEIKVENNNNLIQINNNQLNTKPIIATNILSDNVIILNNQLLNEINQLLIQNVSLFAKNTTIDELNDINNINPLIEQITEIIGIPFTTIRQLVFSFATNEPIAFTSTSEQKVNVEIVFDSNLDIRMETNTFFSSNASLKNVFDSLNTYDLGNFYKVVISNENVGQIEAAIKSSISSSEQITQEELNTPARQQQVLANIQQQANIDLTLIKSITFIPIKKQRAFNIEIKFNENVILSSLNQNLFHVDPKTNIVTNVTPMQYTPIITINQELSQNLSSLINDYISKISLYPELNKKRNIDQLINELNNQLHQYLPNEDLITNIKFDVTLGNPNSTINTSITFNNNVDFETLSNTSFTIANNTDGPVIKMINSVSKVIYTEVGQNDLFINRFNFTKKLFEMCNGNVQSLNNQLNSVDQIKTLFNDQTFINSNYGVSKINDLSCFEYNQDGQYIEFIVVFNDLNVFSRLRIHERYISINPDEIKSLYTYQVGTSLEQGDAIIIGCTQSSNTYDNLIFPEGAVTSSSHFIWGGNENSTLQSVLLPSTYKSVSVHSFSWNYNLKSLTITSPTIELNHWSFGDAKNLTNVVIWSSIVTASDHYALNVGNDATIDLQYSYMTQENYNNFVNFIKNTNSNKSITFIPPEGVINPLNLNLYKLMNNQVIIKLKEE